MATKPDEIWHSFFGIPINMTGLYEFGGRTGLFGSEAQNWANENIAKQDPNYQPLPAGIKDPGPQPGLVGPDLTSALVSATNRYGLTRTGIGRAQMFNDWKNTAGTLLTGRDLKDYSLVPPPAVLKGPAPDVARYGGNNATNLEAVLPPEILAAKKREQEEAAKAAGQQAAGMVNASIGKAFNGSLL